MVEKCRFKFRDLTCSEFVESVQRPDAPEWMRQFATIFCSGEFIDPSTLDMDAVADLLEYATEPVNVMS